MVLSIVKTRYKYKTLNLSYNANNNNNGARFGLVFAAFSFAKIMTSSKASDCLFLLCVRH
jgi:hypothetical protein